MPGTTSRIPETVFQAPGGWIRSTGVATCSSSRAHSLSPVGQSSQQVTLTPQQQYTKGKAPLKSALVTDSCKSALSYSVPVLILFFKLR